MELFIFWIIMAFVTAIVGAGKGGSGFLYFIGGLLCWPIALAVAVMRRPSEQSSQPPTVATISVSDTDLKNQMPHGAPPTPSTRMIEGVVDGIPYWRSDAFYVAVVSGREMMFSDLSMLRAVVAGQSVSAATSQPTQPVETEARIAGLQPSDWRLDLSEDGRVTAKRGEIVNYFDSLAAARAWIVKQKLNE